MVLDEIYSSQLQGKKLSAMEEMHLDFHCHCVDPNSWYQLSVVQSQTVVSKDAPPDRAIFDNDERLRFGLFPRNVTLVSLNILRKLKKE